MNIWYGLKQREFDPYRLQRDLKCGKKYIVSRKYCRFQSEALLLVTKILPILKAVRTRLDRCHERDMQFEKLYGSTKILL